MEAIKGSNRKEGTMSKSETWNKALSFFMSMNREEIEGASAEG